MAICIGLPAVALSYARTIPAPAALITPADEKMLVRMDPTTTGATTPKAEGRSVGAEASTSETKIGSAAWVDPPHRSEAAERSAAVTVETMELRLPRL